MAYAKRYAGGFVDKPTLTTPIDSTFLNAVETALLEALSTDGTVDGQVMQWISASSKFGPALLLNKNVDPAAAIAKSKLDFTGANGIVDADVAGVAAIAQSKISGLTSAIGAIPVNVKNYGAKGDGITDDYAAIVSAYAAIPATGGALFFPDGTYLISAAITFATVAPLSIVGASQFGAIMKPTFAAGDALVVNGPTKFSMANLSIIPSVNRTATAYNLRVIGCDRAVVSNIFMNNGTGSLLMFENVNFLDLSDIMGDTSSGVGGTVGGTCLRIKSTTDGATISGCNFRTSGGAPCLWITGTTTSLEIVNSDFQGGGPHSSFAVTGIVSTGANFTVTTGIAHDFKAGDFLVLRGMTPVAYNNVWRIASVTATTIIVTSTLNPGPSTVNGTAESITACALVTNEDGPVNESRFSNCIFANGYTSLYGYAGLYFDGRRGVANAKNLLSGWNLNGNYYDFGDTGLLISGDKATVANDPTVHGISITGAVFVQKTRGLHIDQAVNITATTLVGSPGAAVAADNISAACALYVYAGAAAPFTQAILIANSTLGSARNFNPATEVSYTYGVVLDSAGMQDLKLTGCQLNGATGPLLLVNSPRVATTSRWQLSADAQRVWLPLSARGMIAEVANPHLYGNTVSPITQSLTGELVGLLAGDVVTGIRVDNNQAAAGTLPTTVRFGIADVTGKILALSGNLNALASWVQGPMPMPFAAPYTILADGAYYLCFVVNGVWGTTQPLLVNKAGATVIAGNQFNGGAAQSIVVAAQTDLPAVGASLSSVAGGNNQVFYMGVY